MSGKRRRNEAIALADNILSDCHAVCDDIPDAIHDNPIISEAGYVRGKLKQSHLDAQELRSRFQIQQFRTVFFKFDICSFDNNIRKYSPMRNGWIRFIAWAKKDYLATIYYSCGDAHDTGPYSDIADFPDDAQIRLV
jgi:hypothetical protein